MGTMRTLCPVQWLAGEGRDVRVLTSHPRTLRPGTPRDDGLLARVPAWVTIVRTGAMRGLHTLERLVRGDAPRACEEPGMRHHVNHLATLTARAGGFPASLYSAHVRRVHRRWLDQKIRSGERAAFAEVRGATA
jgi:hypothetical protein